MRFRPSPISRRVLSRGLPTLTEPKLGGLIGVMSYRGEAADSAIVNRSELPSPAMVGQLTRCELNRVDGVRLLSNAARPGCCRTLAPPQIYPALQKMILASRASGLGTVLTFLHALYEDDVKQVFGLAAEIRTYALLP